MTTRTFVAILLMLIFTCVCGCQPQEEHTVAVDQQSVPQIIQPSGETEGDLQPEFAGPEAVEPEMIEPEEVEPGVVEPEPAKPEEVKAEKAEPEVTKHETEERAEAETKSEPEAQSEKPAFYGKCEHIFTTYVDEEGRVAYDILRRKRAELIEVAREFNKVHPAEKMSWSRNEKIAFWINAHNIFTLRLIVDNYPIQPRWYLINYPDSSIMQLPGGRTKKYFKVMGMEYTLREIEREILLERFGDPRIFFTLSYASTGGAFLRNEAYYPDKLDVQLDEQARKFLSSPQGMKIDHTKKIVVLSDIFNWYRKAFIEKYGSIKKFRGREPHIRAYLNFIINYVSGDDAAYLRSDDYQVGFQLYDWRLNEQPGK